MKKVLLLLAEGFELFEASVFIDVIGWNLVDGDGSTQLFTCGLSKEVKSTFNQKMIVDFIVEEINAANYDALAIPGGFSEYGFYSSAYDPRFSDLIRRFHEQDKIIATICTGAFPVAKSGILNGQKGTTYNMNPERQQQLAEMGVDVIQQPIVRDGNIITSWNPATALDVAFQLLEVLTSVEQSAKIRKLMGFTI